MIELSIITGNDFTSQYVTNGLNGQIDIRGRKCVETFAEWVNRYDRIENHQRLSKEMVKENSHSCLFHLIPHAFILSMKT